MPENLTQIRFSELQLLASTFQKCAIEYHIMHAYRWLHQLALVALARPSLPSPTLRGTPPNIARLSSHADIIYMQHHEWDRCEEMSPRLSETHNSRTFHVVNNDSQMRVAPNQANITLHDASGEE